jgi:hypothetical protein
VLYLERARHFRSLGMDKEADEADRPARLMPQIAWDHLAAGRTYLAAGEAQRAADPLR